MGSSNGRFFMTKQTTLLDTLYNMPDKPEFDGTCYDSTLDKVRLTGQIERVYNAVKDGKWRTLSEIAVITGDGESSISAQLRNLRKPRFGWHRIDKQRRGGGWEYKLEVNERIR